MGRSAFMKCQISCTYIVKRNKLNVTAPNICRNQSIDLESKLVEWSLNSGKVDLKWDNKESARIILFF